jgi:hypothetical protein
MHRKEGTKEGGKGRKEGRSLGDLMGFGDGACTRPTTRKEQVKPDVQREANHFGWLKMIRIFGRSPFFLLLFLPCFLTFLTLAIRRRRFWNTKSKSFSI